MPGAGLAYPGTSYPDAEVAELVDALASGASGGIPVEVRVLFSAPPIQCLCGFARILLKSHAISHAIEIRLFLYDRGKTFKFVPQLSRDVRPPTVGCTPSDIAARCRKQKALMSQQRRT